MFKRVRSAASVALAVATLAGSMTAFYSSPFVDAIPLLFNQEPEAITRYRLQRLSTDALLDEIRTAVATDEFSDAGDLVRIGRERGHQIPPDVVASTVEPTTDTVLRNSSGFAKGFISGEVDSVPSVLGAVAADYLVIGDVRDTYTEGGKLLSGEDYDRLTLGISLFGIVVTLAPGTGPLDVGASILKNASKAGKMSAKLSARLALSVNGAIDLDILKKGLASMPAPKVSFSGLPRLTSAISDLTVEDVTKFNFSKIDGAAKEAWPFDVSAARRQFDGVLKPGAVAELRVVASSIGSIQNDAGIRSVFKVLERADTPAELGRFKSLAKSMGDRTAGVVRLFGKGAIRLGDLIFEIVAAFVFAIAWCFGAAWTATSSFLSLRRRLRSQVV